MCIHTPYTDLCDWRRIKVQQVCAAISSNYETCQHSYLYGMEVIGNILHCKGQPVTSLSIFDAVMDFLSIFHSLQLFLATTSTPSMFLHHPQDHNLCGEFKRHITDFADLTLMAKVALPDVATYKQEECITKYLTESYDAHNAVDVDSLIELSDK